MTSETIAPTSVIRSVAALNNRRVRSTIVGAFAWKVVQVFGVINFVAFLALSCWLGGEAFGGKVERGHYFLGAHGRFREVDHATFLYSVIHGSTALLGLIVVAIATNRMSNGSNDRQPRKPGR